MFHVKHNEHTYHITFLHKISKNEFLKNIIKNKHMHFKQFNNNK